MDEVKCECHSPFGPKGCVCGRAKHQDGCLRASKADPRRSCHGCGGAFKCDACGKIVGNCFGASDDKPGRCDDCKAGVFVVGYIAYVNGNPIIYSPTARTMMAYPCVFGHAPTKCETCRRMIVVWATEQDATNAAKAEEYAPADRKISVRRVVKKPAKAAAAEGEATK